MSGEAVKVRRLVMFKHGVAYLERGGPAEGSFELSFKRSEMNDVLKSLTAWVASGSGRVGAVGFEAPDDPREVLAERNLVLEPGDALAGMVHALKGRAVVVDDGAETVRGEVIGTDERPGPDGEVRRRLLLRTGRGEIGVVDLGRARRIELCEAPSRADVELLVDRSRAASAGTNRNVKIDLAGRAEDLRVTYVVPAPVWRVSYRVVHEAGTTVLMAWAIVHNPADEDLDDIELTLTTGQPVSFVIELYRAKRVERTVVEERSRVAAAPQHFEQALALAPPPPAPAAALPRMAPPPAPGGPAAPFGPPQAVAAKAAMVDAIVAAARNAAEAQDRGELFEYRVASPVSLKRGGSAMVPLASAKVVASKQRFWRDGTGTSPDLVLRFDNDTGLVLEEGPTVVYDDGGYAGEAMLGYSARGAEVKLAFAKDLAVRCRHEQVSGRELVGVTLGDGALIEEVCDQIEHKLRAESDHDDEVKVIFELPKTPGRKLDKGGAQPLEETASFWRFAVDVPPHGAAQAMVRESWRVRQRVEHRSVGAIHLGRWRDGRLLDDASLAALERVLAARERASALDAEREALGRDRQDALDRQTKITEQLAVLRDTGSEGALRERYVAELGQEQDEVRRLEQAMRRRRADALAMRERADRDLVDLARARPSPE